MRALALALFVLTACDPGTPPNPAIDGGPDAYVPSPDAGSIAHDGGSDAGSTRTDGGTDAGPIDAGSSDAGSIDARVDGGGADAAIGDDAGAIPDGGACAISAGHTLALDGVGDPGEYPAAQVLAPGAPLSSADTFALTWDPDFLYVTVSSSAFEDAFKPLHVYLEASTALAAPAATTGKEYGGHTANLPFTPTHVIAVRRTSDSGTGGPYNGVYTPAGGWSDRATPLELGSSYWISGDDRTISVRVPWTSLGGCPSALRLSAHVIHGAVANEWKDLVPATATPWLAGGGAYYELDLSGDPAITGWTLR